MMTETRLIGESRELIGVKGLDEGWHFQSTVLRPASAGARKSRMTHFRRALERPNCVLMSGGRF
jgi:hypothetical protein